MDGLFTVEFVLLPNASSENLRALGDAIWSWYSEHLSGDLSQYYMDHSGGDDPCNFAGPELQALREGRHLGQRSLLLRAYDGHPHYSWSKFVSILRPYISKALVQDVLIDGVSWNDQMGTYHTELQRRIEQFAHYLKLMHHRAHEEAWGNCFIIFEERPSDRSSGGEELSEKKRLVLERVIQAFAQSWDSEGLDESVVDDLPDDGWREDDSQNRYIQFSFERNWFCMDLPLETLYRPEAENILRNRQGFFYLRDRLQFALYGEEQEDVKEHDPFRKVYVYGDEGSAGEDMAYIFFQVWKFPVDARFYVTAAAFNGKHTWEQGYPIE